MTYFLKEYSEKFDRQILLITHHDELAEAADSFVTVKKVKGVAVVKCYTKDKRKIGG